MMPVAHQKTAIRIDMQGRVYLGAPASNSFLMKTNYKVKGSDVSHNGLILLPEGVFDELANKVNAGLSYREPHDARRIRRLFFSGFLQPHDDHGRVAIPQVMLTYAGLGSCAYITQRHNYFVLTSGPVQGDEIESTTLDAIVRAVEVRSLQRV